MLMGTLASVEKGPNSHKKNKADKKKLHKLLLKVLKLTPDAFALIKCELLI